MIGIIILSILSSVGASLIITKSWIFSRIRENCKREFFGVLLSCPQCSSTWIGTFSGILTLPIISIPLYQSILYVIAVAFISSLIAELIEKIIYE